MPFNQILEPYKHLIDDQLKKNIDQLGKKNPLRDACEYALLNGGKRFRPALVFMIAKALGHKIDVSSVAMGIEFFHTASLIADDLPCMDNDDERRNKPTLHRVYGESIAILSTYALISAGYSCLVKNTQMIQNSNHPIASQINSLCVIALENVSYNTGIFGATGGQYLDLSPPNFSLDLICEVLHKKTVTLFEISFVLGWIFGGGGIQQLDLIKKSSRHFGMAFQIADDIGDMTQDQSHLYSLNIANLLGIDEAIKIFHSEIGQFKQTLNDLKLENSDLNVLSDLLVHQVNCVKEQKPKL